MSENTPEENKILEEQFKEEENRNKFEKELSDLINRYSLENGSNTPDFILAEYLRDCLEIFEYAVRDREKWHGNKNQPL